VPPELKGYIVHDFSIDSEEHYFYQLTMLEDPVGILAYIYNFNAAEMAEYESLRNQYCLTRLNNVSRFALCQGYIARSDLRCEAIVTAWARTAAQCVFGKMGAGKTQFLLNYAINSPDIRQYAMVHWLSGGDLVTSIRRTALRAGINFSGQALSTVLGKLFQKLSAAPCLLIVDNVATGPELDCLLLELRKFPTIRILFNTQQHHFSTLTLTAHELADFSEADACQYLQRVAINFLPSNPEHQQIARTLFAKFGKSPGSLKWLVQIMNSRRLTIADFSQRLADKNLVVIETYFKDKSRYFEEKLRSRTPDELVILNCLAYLDPTGVNRSQFAALLAQRLAVLDELIVTLANAGLLRLVPPKNDWVNADPFLAIVLRERGTVAEQCVRYNGMIETIIKQLQLNDSIEIWLTHAKYLLDLSLPIKAQCAIALQRLQRFYEESLELQFQQGVIAYKRSRKLEQNGEIVASTQYARQAAEYYHVAANLGHSKAKTNLYLLQQKSKTDLLNSESALELLQQAATAGQPRAMYELSRHFFKQAQLCDKAIQRAQRDGLKATGEQWLQRAATAGDLDAQEFLRTRK
jgi:hypothetical protein